MTKTETQIAEENVEVYKNPFPDGIEGNPWTDKIRSGVQRDAKETCGTHKATCQRFSEFLEERTKWGSWKKMSIFAKQNVKDKITDLKQAIKLYEDAGI